MSQLLYGPFSLTDVLAAKLTFWTWSYTEYGNDTIYWGAADNPYLFAGERSSGSRQYWPYEEFSLGNVPVLGSLIGEPEVYIMFSFESNDWSTRKHGWFLDDIRLVKLTRGTASDIEEFLRGTNDPSATGEPALVRAQMQYLTREPGARPVLRPRSLCMDQ